MLIQHADNGKGLLEAPNDPNQDVLELLGSHEWEGVAVGFLLAKVTARVICLRAGILFFMVKISRGVRSDTARL